MLKFLLFAGIGCVGIVVAVAFYAAWKITKMGRDLGRGGVSGSGGRSSSNRHDDYITTTGTTVNDWQHRNDFNSSDDSSSRSELGYSAGDSIGSDIGSSATDFSSSSDSGSSDSGSSDSGGSSSSD